MASPARSQGPADRLNRGRAFYAGLDLDVGHFAAMWHGFNVGQLLANDLNAICRRHGVSLADFHLLGALMIEPDRPWRATDIAQALNVSAAVLSGRTRRLDRAGLIRRGATAADRRAVPITITEAGTDKVRTVGAALEEQAHFVRHYRALPEADRAALDRILAGLHDAMDRDHLPVVR